MPAKDFYHDIVRQVLEKDGWKITHDPYFMRIGRRKGYIDLGAEMVAAERGNEKIAVEIKSFIGLSDLNAFEDALGQFLLYKPALAKKEPDRLLLLAIPNAFYTKFFDDPFFLEVAELYELKMLIFNEKDATVLSWKK
ncbi:MAG TPA: XisH family protein [Saprospiraceae bacterium]|nr:XisH family protein [Saprospiraceae bacterium]